MSEALPLALRKRIVAAHVEDGQTYIEIAARFAVGEASVSRVLRRWREKGDLAPDPHGGGNPPRIPREQFDALRALVADMPDATRQELCDQWEHLHHVHLSVASMGRTLRDAGITRKKSSSTRRSKSGRTSRLGVTPSRSG